MTPNLNSPQEYYWSRGLGSLNLIFAHQFKWTTNNNIFPGGPVPLNLMFANQFNRAGVEDTRLEAKDTRLEAKDTKKIRGQGQGQLSENTPSRGQGQECSRPRTKDTSASVPIEKGLKNFFSGVL